MVRSAVVVALVLGAGVLAGWLAPVDAAQRHKSCEDVCGVQYLPVPVYSAGTAHHAHRPR